MRILLVSDLHYTLPQLDWLVHSAPSFDLVVIAGDHLDVSSPVSLDTQSMVLLRYFSMLKPGKFLVLASGNHDLTGADRHGERAALWLPESRRTGVFTDGDSVHMDGSTVDNGRDTLITICPWWDGPAGRGEVERQLAADASRRPARWAWVYHWPPMGSPTCWTGKRHYGDADLAGWIARFQPELVLTGHVHEPPFKPAGAWADRIGSTWVFNAGRQIGPVPAHIVLDLEAGTAAWHSMMGEESLALDAKQSPARTVF
ncbi:MAG: phosphohydrolase [Variovorax sp.]|nr:MAG: phosphohydrolase [Variovorax sp.]